MQAQLAVLPVDARPGELADLVAAHGIRWVLHTHARWRDIPEAYAASTTCWRWYKRWCDEGTWAQIEAALGR